MDSNEGPKMGTSIEVNAMLAHKKFWMARGIVLLESLLITQILTRAKSL